MEYVIISGIAALIIGVACWAIANALERLHRLSALMDEVIAKHNQLSKVVDEVIQQHNRLASLHATVNTTSAGKGAGAEVK